MSADDALEHARRLAAPVQRQRGASSVPTELFDDGQVPEHLGLRSEVERIRGGLSLTIEVSIRDRQHLRRLTSAVIVAVLLAGAAVGLALVALVGLAWVALALVRG